MSSAITNRSAITIQDLPDRPMPAVVPVARPAPTVSVKPPAIRQPAVVNWRTVGLVGAISWLWVVGLLMGVWAMSNSARPPVVVVAPEPALQETPLPVIQAVVEPKPKIEPKPVVLFGPPMPTPEEMAMLEYYKPAISLVVKAPPAKAPEKTGSCGTAVDFLTDPAEAMEKAEASKKLVFLVHVAGDFEDPGFT